MRCYEIQFSLPWIHMAASSGFRFMLSYGIRIDMQIPAPHSARVSKAPSIQTTWQETILASV